MTDHLTRLAWRALGLLPVAQPRLPSRFAEGGDDLFELPAEGWAPSEEKVPILEPAPPPALRDEGQDKGQAGGRPAAPAPSAAPRRPAGAGAAEAEKAGQAAETAGGPDPAA